MATNAPAHWVAKATEDMVLTMNDKTAPAFHEEECAISVPF